MIKGAEDDFIEDDDGNGYTDYGQDEWKEESPSEGELDLRDRKLAGKKRSNSTLEPVINKKHQITSLFQRASTQAPKQKTAKASDSGSQSKVNDDALLTSIFDALDEDLESADSKPSIVKVKSEPLEDDDEAITESYRAADAVDIKEEAVAAAPLKSEIISSIVGNEEKRALDGADSLKSEPLKVLEELPESWNLKDCTMDQPSATLMADLSDCSNSSTLPLMQGYKINTDGDLDFFYYDAAERDGLVYLFGKIWSSDAAKFVSCSVVVQNMQRNVFLLPKRQPIDQEDEDLIFSELYEEVNAVRQKIGIAEWRTKMVTRKYCFEIEGIPREARYMKVVYSYKYPKLNRELFRDDGPVKHAFGVDNTALERFITKRKIMGPSWLKLKNATLIADVYKGRSTWCGIELEAKSMKDICPSRDQSKAMPLNILAIQAHSVRLPGSGDQEHARQFVMISGTVYDDFVIDETNENLKSASFCLATVPKGGSFPVNVPFLQEWTTDAARLKNGRGCHNFSVWYHRSRASLHDANRPFCYRAPNEESLLTMLMSIISTCDPDIVVGHYLIDGLRELLYHRLAKNAPRATTQLGKFIKPPPHYTLGGNSAKKAANFSFGRLWTDTYLAAQDTVKVDSYTLAELVRTQLNLKLPPIDIDKIWSYYDSRQSLEQLVLSTNCSVALTYELMNRLQVLPLTRQLTNLAGNLWRKTLANSRSDRNEYLLLHEFHRQKFIVPDKVSFKKTNSQASLSTSQRRKPQYAGGLVLEPKKGFYEHYVLLLDFNSLYPSIIREYNIDFTTVTRALGEGDNLELPELPRKDLPQGVLPKLLSSLVERRRQVKAILQNEKDAIKKLQLDVRQKALKLTANSMYGCLGAEISRFYAKPLAMLITARGRAILQETVDLAGNQGMDVIYGDTDSIMIATHCNNLKQAKELGDTLRKAVNNKYQLLEIGLDGVFRKLLLLQKKMYAALIVSSVDPATGEATYKRETKGLSVVRRDWCNLSRMVCLHIIDQMMPLVGDLDSNDFIDNVCEYLCQVGDQVRAGKFDVGMFAINKGLNKEISHYVKDSELPPQAKVALYLRDVVGRTLQVGDTISYLVCKAEDPKKCSVSDRAKHVSLVHGVDELDLEWYLSNQILPPVARLLNPIEGFGEARVASCLGLDVTKFSSGNSVRHDGFTQSLNAGEQLESQLCDADRFKDASKFHTLCPHCHNVRVWSGVFNTLDDGPASSFTCTSCQKVVPVAAVQWQLCRSVQAQVHMYQQGWLVCDDPLCRNETTFVGGFGRSCLVPGCSGTMHLVYSNSMIDRQLSYYESLFDTDRYRKKQGFLPAEVDRILLHDSEKLKTLVRQVRKISLKNRRQFVEFGKLFAPYTKAVSL